MSVAGTFAIPRPLFIAPATGTDSDPSSSGVSSPIPRTTCGVCPRHCSLAPGQVGFCRARANVGGTVACTAYGRVTSLALDPIEKKPIADWRPGTRVLSLGGYGCNLRCPWCQNFEISQAGERDVPWRQMTPAEVVGLAEQLREEDPACIGIAYTYNEPLVAWEFVRDCAELAHEHGLANVLVSNGCAEPAVIAALAPLLDAANIDLKTFSPAVYGECGGDLGTVEATIRVLAATPGCHLEVTTLVVPGVNDTDGEMRRLAGWLAGVDPEVTLHVTRFFPRWKMADKSPTPVVAVRHLASVARESLPHVHTGNL